MTDSIRWTKSKTGLNATKLGIKMDRLNGVINFSIVAAGYKF